MKTCLQIVQTVAKRIGISTPNTAASATDVQVQQLLSLLNEGGEDLAARYAWEALVNEATFTTVATESQGELQGDIIATASGFQYIVNDTMWDRTQNVPVYGPNSSQQWQYLKSSNVSGPYSTYRIRGGLLLMTPAPAAGRTVAFEWVTNHWVTNADGDVTRVGFEADDDVPLLSDRLLQSDLVWRWKASKGLAYQEDFNKHERNVMDAMARDGSKPQISMGGKKPGFDPIVIAPSGNWPL